VVHANARLTPAGRLLLCQRIAAGRPVAHIAAEMGISRTCAYRWWARYQQLGQPGLLDRPSTAHTHPRRVPDAVQAEIARLRRTASSAQPGSRRWSAGRPPPSTVCWSALGLNRLAFMDRPTGRLIRRYERAQPGELVHLDVKKLGRLRPGGGHRAHGRASAQHRTRSAKPGSGPGYDYIHAAVDDRSRLAYAEVLGDERAPTCAGFLLRAAAFYAAHGITIQRVMTDNAAAYRRGGAFRAAVQTLGASNASPASTDPRPTARSSGSTAPCWPSGPTCGPTPTTTSAPPPWTPGSTCTTITARTPRSAAAHPSARVNNAPGAYS
jgi:transposase-like protein